MRRTLLCTGLLGALLLSVITVTAMAQEFMKPTKQHAAMKHEVGTWDAEVSMWMSPESEPVKNKAVETNEMLGEMWLMSKFEGEFGGEKFTGASALGYDPIKKKFTGGWVDSMSPFMMKMEGDYDSASHTLTMMGEGVDAMTGKPSKTKLVTIYTDQDTKTFEMFHEGEDKDDEMWRMMEIKYTRRK